MTAWDAIAAGYDRTNTPSQMWLGNEGLRRAGLRPGMRFLDVAAGSGALSIPAARLGARVLATDLSPAMLELLERRARDEGLSIETQVMDGHALELEDDSFDMAGSQFGVMLFPDMPKGIAEMARVVRPGGRVLMTAYGDPHAIEFLGVFVAAVQAAVPSFEGPPMDPLPLPFQLHDPERLRQRARGRRAATTSRWRRSPSGPSSAPASTCGTGWSTATRSWATILGELGLTEEQPRWSATRRSAWAPTVLTAPGQHRDRHPMSNAEALARAFAGWGKDKPANLRELLHPDCELVVPESLPYGGTFRGADAVIALVHARPVAVVRRVHLHARGLHRRRRPDRRPGPRPGAGQERQGRWTCTTSGSTSSARAS